MAVKIAQTLQTAIEDQNIKSKVEPDQFKIFNQRFGENSASFDLYIYSKNDSVDPQIIENLTKIIQESIFILKDDKLKNQISLDHNMNVEGIWVITVSFQRI